MVPMGSWGISGALGVPSFGFFSYFSPHFKLFLSSPIIVFYYLRLSFVPRTGTRLSRKQLWMLCPVTKHSWEIPGWTHLQNHGHKKKIGKIPVFCSHITGILLHSLCWPSRT